MVFSTAVVSLSPDLSDLRVRVWQGLLPYLGAIVLDANLGPNSVSDSRL